MLQILIHKSWLWGYLLARHIEWVGHCVGEGQVQPPAGFSSRYFSNWVPVSLQISTWTSALSRCLSDWCWNCPRWSQTWSWTRILHDCYVASQLLKHIVLYCYVGSPCVRYIAKYFLVLTGVKSSKVKFPVQCNKNVLYTDHNSQCYKRLALTKYV